MDIHINKHDVRVDEERARERVEKNLGRFYERLTRIEIFLHDENSVKGGIDKRCLIEARPRGLDPLTAESVAKNALEAVSGAAKKLERLLEHRFGRLEDRPR